MYWIRISKFSARHISITKLFARCEVISGYTYIDFNIYVLYVGIHVKIPAARVWFTLFCKFPLMNSNNACMCIHENRRYITTKSCNNALLTSSNQYHFAVLENWFMYIVGGIVYCVVLMCIFKWEFECGSFHYK